jgi:hypothetical protein
MVLRINVWGNFDQKQFENILNSVLFSIFNHQDQSRALDVDASKAVFWIRDILIWIRLGADPYHALTDPDPALFVSELQDPNKKIILFYYRYLSFSSLLFEGTQGTFKSFFKDKSHK